MGRRVVVAVTTLNQWALDFDGNLERIIASIELAKAAGAKLRVGAELEVCGYSCQDHFYESDTFLHCWESLATLLAHPVCRGMIVTVGMPVMHKNVAYNCQVAFHDGRVLLIRPKTILADDGNYRETRFFTAFVKLKTTEEFFLPRLVQKVAGQAATRFGDAVVSTVDTCFGFEICEELWNPKSSHVDMGLDGVEIFVNGSGSYTELRKAHVSVDLVKAATAKSGGAYLFSNLRGCDGERVYFNGCSSVALNGQIVARTKQFSIEEVEVATAVVDLEDVRAYRNAFRSRNVKAAASEAFPRIRVEVSLGGDDDAFLRPSPAIEWSYHTPEEEILLGPACWLWDYLRRSRQGGFFLPLSGGADSASTATVVFSMCNLVVEAVRLGNDAVLDEVRRVVGEQGYVPTDPRELCGRIFFTCYMGSENSSRETRARAEALAAQLGTKHVAVSIDVAVAAVLKVFRVATGKSPAFDGDRRENLALQNVQARVRMVLSYLFAQLSLWARGRPGGLLVLGSSNVDEALRGYMTKYDCSSADVNPIGGFSKTDLKRFLAFARDKFGFGALGDVLEATPTAELQPLEGGEGGEGRIAQTDEEDMGMTYAELSEFGRLRQQNRCGPFSMFGKLVHEWSDRCSPEEVAEKVKRFFTFYAANRHKMTVLTPSYHAESYSPDDNRFDHRPFLYNCAWTRQFGDIDGSVEALKKAGKSNN